MVSLPNCLFRNFSLSFSTHFFDPYAAGTRNACLVKTVLSLLSKKVPGLNAFFIIALLRRIVGTPFPTLPAPVSHAVVFREAQLTVLCFRCF